MSKQVEREWRNHVEQRCLTDKPHYLRASQLEECTVIPSLCARPGIQHREGSRDSHCHYKSHIQNWDKSNSGALSPPG